LNDSIPHLPHGIGMEHRRNNIVRCDQWSQATTMAITKASTSLTNILLSPHTHTTILLYYLVCSLNNSKKREE
jgi:hypothetical protein